MNLQIIFVLCFVFSSLTANVTAWLENQESDHISALPGQPPVTFKQYSGYVTVNESEGRALFYWLTEATHNAYRKPLVLWLNGGPGCSSIGYGASEELGPFRINKTGASLYLNKYSWNNVANILFLESPAGVGFSYTNTSSNLFDSGDERTAHDALIFVIRWMRRFPQYKYRDFYIAGESYAGNYVPQLARKIHNLNKKSTHPMINLKGFIVGNAVMDSYYDNIGAITYAWSHSIISDHTYDLIMTSCDFSSQNYTNECYSALDYMQNHENGNIDPYSIYTPTCGPSQVGSKVGSRPKKSLSLKNRFMSGPQFFGYDPCVENYASVYYNRPDVQKALHANTTGISYRWSTCSNTLFTNWRDTEFSMLPTYKKLIAAGLRIWVFSGDTDAVVPVTGTRFSLRSLHLKIRTPWYPWYAAGQVGGWTEVYEGLTFATVRGAGHEVPLFEPRRAFELFKAFLAGEELPRS